MTFVYRSPCFFCIMLQIFQPYAKVDRFLASEHTNRKKIQLDSNCVCQPHEVLPNFARK